MNFYFRFMIIGITAYACLFIKFVLHILLCEPLQNAVGLNGLSLLSGTLLYFFKLFGFL